MNEAKLKKNCPAQGDFCNFNSILANFQVKIALFLDLIRGALPHEKSKGGTCPRWLNDADAPRLRLLALEAPTEITHSLLHILVPV